MYISKKSRKLMTFIISYFMSIVSTSIRENLKFQCIEIKQTKKKAEKRTNFLKKFVFQVFVIPMFTLLAGTPHFSGSITQLLPLIITVSFQ